MAYDPQAGHRRPKPSDDDPAPIDALIGGDPLDEPVPANAVPDDPPPTPAVTPAPADPPPDTLLLNTGIAGAVATVVGLLTLRHLWRRRRARRAPAAATAGEPAD